MSAAPSHVVAVVVWYCPDDDARAHVAAAARQCAGVLVVDNTPGSHPASPPPLPPSARYLPLGVNRGLAGALNAAVAELPAACDALLLLDQDSSPPEGMVPALARHLVRADVAAAGPAPWDDDAGRYLDPRTALRPPVAALDAVITSGMLLRRTALEEVGPFREDFFVDAVDQDLCLRLRAAGWAVLQDRSVHLPHRLGDTTWHRLLGLRLRATHHADRRLYTGARNGTVLVREHALRRPRWAVRNALQLLYWLLVVLAFEPPRVRRAGLFLRGVVDGLLGRPARVDPGGGPR